MRLLITFFGLFLLYFRYLAVTLHHKTINVQMNRFFSIFLLAFGAFLSLHAAEVTFDFSTADGITAMG